jgi:hypothetical protein
MTTDAAAPVTEVSRPPTKKPVARGPQAVPDEGPGKGAEKLSRRDRKARRKLRARRVERIMRRIDPWSVLKLSFLFFLCLYVIFMLAGVILWTAAANTDAIDNVEQFIEELFALRSFRFEGEQIFRGAAVGGLVMVVVSTAFSVLIAVLFNLISDLTGGIRVSVIELENLRQPADKGTASQGSRRAPLDAPNSWG